MDQILQAILNGASGEELAAIPLPTTYRAAFVRKEDQNMWDGIPSEQKDPRKSLHIGEVPLPEIAPDEVVVAVMASSINFNTVWTSIFEPISTFGALARLGRESSWAKRHDLDYHVVGSDASNTTPRAMRGALLHQSPLPESFNLTRVARRGAGSGCCAARDVRRVVRPGVPASSDAGSAVVVRR